MTTRGEINSNFYQIVNVDANGAPTSVKPEYLPNVGNANYAANAGHANISDVANLVAVANVSGIGNIATVNLSGDGSQVLLGNGTWGAGSGNTANANYANFAGTAFNVSGSNVTGIVGNATHANFADVANSVSAANISGTVNLANYATVANSVAVANVSGIGNIATVNLDGNSSNILFGNGVFSASPSTANANVANTALGITAVALSSGNILFANSTGTGNKSVSVASGMAWSTIAATLTISGGAISTGRYTSNVLTGTAPFTVTSTTRVANLNVATAGVADSANAVAGANVTGQVANALVAGTVYTNAQPNITSVGTLTDLTVTGNIQSYADISGAYIYGNGAFLTGVGNLSASNGYWGSFYSNVTQTIASTTTAYAITLNNTDPDSHGVSISSNSHINFTYAGTYNLQFSAQFDNASLTSEDASVWLRKNGVDVIDSRGQVSVPSSHGGLNGQIIESWNYVLKVAAGDYLELYWQAESTSVSMAYLGAGTTPTTPASPSIIVTAMQVTNVQPVELQGAMTGNIVGNGYSLLNIASISSLDGITGNTFTGNGAPLTNLTGANVVGNVGNAVHAYFADVANSVAGANVSGYVANATHATVADSANSVAGANVTGQVAFAAVANSVAGANVSGYVANATHATVADSANSVSAANIVGTVNLANYATVANSVAVANVSGIGNIATVNLTGSSSNVLYGNGVFAPAAGDANYANFAGQVVDAAQSNITTLGTLTSLNVEGNINGNTALYIGDTSNSTGLTNPIIVAKAGGATYVQSSVVNGTAEGSADLVAYGDNGSDSGAWADIGFTGSNFSDPVYTITGKNDGYFFVLGDDASVYGGNLVIATGAQGTNRDIVFATGGFQASDEKMRLINNDNQFNISMTTTSSNNTTGAFVVAGGVGISGDVYAGNIVSANYFVGDGGFLSNITATGNVSNANYASYAGNAFSVSGSNVSGAVAYATTANSVAVANVVGIGNIATVNLTGSTSNVLYGNGVFAPITVTSVANANYSNFAGEAFSVSASNIVGTVNLANYATVANSVAGINVTGTVANATYAITSGEATVAGTVTSAAQPNITSVGTLSSLSVTGNITSGNASLGNLASASYFSGNGSLLTSITAANINGTVANATYATTAGSATTAVTVTGGSQPNITSVGTLASLTATGNITGNYFIGNGSALTGVTASPAGSNTYIQFNDNGSTNGVAGLTFNKTSNLMSIGNAGSITIGLGTGTDFVTLNSPAGSGNIAAGGTVIAVNANISNVALTKFTETLPASANTSTSIAPNLASGTIVRYTANASFSFNGFTSPVAGQSGTVIITQDATGGRTMSSTMKFAGGSKTLSTAANAIDIICVFYDGTTYYATLSKGYA
jgi:hypothetical protein